MALGEAHLAEIESETFRAESWIGRSEDDWLDFKSSGTRDGSLTIDDLDNLGVALSAFANSDGGLIVWGVTCKREDGVDVASDLPGIPDATRFRAQLEANCGKLCDPPVRGVRHSSVVSESGKEIVVTYVPATEAGLHRTMRKNHHSFYYRAGSQSTLMPTWLIAERFGRRPFAALVPKMTIRVHSGGSFGQSYQLAIHVENVGRVAAYQPAVAVTLRGHLRKLDWPVRDQPTGFTQITSMISEEGRRFFNARELVVYPSMPVDVTWFNFDLPHQPDESDYPDAQFDLTVFVDNKAVSRSFLLSAVDMAGIGAQPKPLRSTDPDATD